MDGHHIVHWADGGETRLDNLVSLCRQHHRLLHEGGYGIVEEGAAFRFFRADGVEVPTLPRKRLECIAGQSGSLGSSRWQRVTRWGSAPIPPPTGPP